MTRKFAGILAAAALASACGTSGSTTTGTASGSTSGSSTTGGTTTTTSGTGSTTSSTTTTSGFCNGVQMADNASVPVYYATYPKADEIRTNCTHLVDPLLSDAGFTVGYFAGILDRNTYVNTGTLYTVWPAGCDDLDGGASGYVAGNVVPDGGVSVAAALAAQAAIGTTPLYGIITYINSPYVSATGGTITQHSGTAWIQDLVPAGGTPAPGSGVSIYFNKTSANAGDGGFSGPGYFPSTGVNRGDVVAFTNLKWSPYVPSTNSTGLAQNQFEFIQSAGSTVTVIGQGTLPPPVSLTGFEFQDAGGKYMGMRVVQSTTPNTVVNTCPLALFTP